MCVMYEKLSDWVWLGGSFDTPITVVAIATAWMDLYFDRRFCQSGQHSKSPNILTCILSKFGPVSIVINSSPLTKRRCLWFFLTVEPGVLLKSSGNNILLI